MGVIDRCFRLSDEPGGLGLSCSMAGLALAGVPLLRKREAGFVPRPAEEIGALVKAAYGDDASIDDLLPGLGTVARALNCGDLPLAMIAAVLRRLPELNWDAAARLATAEDRLRKYNLDEPRDWHGCWISDDAPDASGQDRLPEYPFDFASGVGDADPADDASPLERKYDSLGPVEFAKQVIQFGDRLGREGKSLSAEERQDALAEYIFLQNRLSFWQAYDDKPFEAQANLNSAAITLYDGAMLSGIVQPGGKYGGIPQSMVEAVVGAMALDGPQQGLPLRGRSIGADLDYEIPAGRRSTNDGIGGVVGELTPNDDLGAIADNAKVGIDWNNGIVDKGIPWERYIAIENPDARVLEPGTKTFDLFDDPSGQAVSAKVLDPLSYGYINRPQRIYYRVKGYVDAAANYSKTRAEFDLNPSTIHLRTIRLGVRDYVTPSQWQQLYRAIWYGKSRGVAVFITRIRD